MFLINFFFLFTLKKIPDCLGEYIALNIIDIGLWKEFCINIQQMYEYSVDFPGVEVYGHQSNKHQS